MSASTDPRPSLAELREAYSVLEEFAEKPRQVVGRREIQAIEEITFGMPFLLDIAEPAYAVERERLHRDSSQACDCGCYTPSREAIPVLRNALSKVRP